MYVFSLLSIQKHDVRAHRIVDVMRNAQTDEQTDVPSGSGSCL